MSATVKIMRGRFSPRFQVVRAWLSAASAVVLTNHNESLTFIDMAILELKQLKVDMMKN